MKFASASVDFDLSARHLEANVVRIILRSCKIHAMQLQQRTQAYDTDVITSCYRTHLKLFITAKIIEIDQTLMMLFDDKVCSFDDNIEF